VERRNPAINSNMGTSDYAPTEATAIFEFFSVPAAPWRALRYLLDLNKD
jgi:hypothetical protein